MCVCVYPFTWPARDAACFAGVILGAAKCIFNYEADVRLLGTEKLSIADGRETLHCATFHIRLPAGERNLLTTQHALEKMKDFVTGVAPDPDHPVFAAINSDANSSISLGVFCSAVLPWHFVLDKKLRFKQVGVALAKFCPMIRAGRCLKDVCKVFLPRVPCDYYHFLNYTNNNFDVWVLEPGDLPYLVLKGREAGC